MDNSILRKEAVRITKELIKIYESDKDLDHVFHEILDKKYMKYDMKVLMYISNALYDEGYTLDSVTPFKLRRVC